MRGLIESARGFSRATSGSGNECCSRFLPRALDKAEYLDENSPPVIRRSSIMRIRWFIALAALVAAMLPAVQAQVQTAQKNPRAEWPMYNRDLGGTRFSPLVQINVRNVGRLTRAWTYKVGKVKA